MAKSIELNPKEYLCQYYHALICFGTGEIATYRKACAAMLGQFRESQSPSTAYFTAWTCALGPSAVEDFADAVALADKALKSDPKSVAHLTILGAVLFRGGQAERAVERLTEANKLLEALDSDAKSPPPYTWYFLAMAHHAAGHAEEAKTWLEKAVESTDKALEEHEQEGGARIGWNRRLTLQLLRDEAERLIGPTKEKAEPERAKDK